MVNPKLRDAIDHFCMKEYGVMGDFENPKRIPLLYTTVRAEEVEEYGDPGFEYELQIYIDAVHARAIYCLGEYRLAHIIPAQDQPETGIEPAYPH